jgi:hypothetical protein
VTRSIGSRGTFLVDNWPDPVDIFPLLWTIVTGPVAHRYPPSTVEGASSAVHAPPMGRISTGGGPFSASMATRGHAQIVGLLHSIHTPTERRRRMSILTMEPKRARTDPWMKSDSAMDTK